eukprot:gene17705-24063_t
MQRECALRSLRDLRGAPLVDLSLVVTVADACSPIGSRRCAAVNGLCCSREPMGAAAVLPSAPEFAMAIGCNGHGLQWDAVEHIEREGGAMRLDLHASLAALARRRPMRVTPEFGMRVSPEFLHQDMSGR